MFLKGFTEFINESESNVTYQDLKLLLELGISEDITSDVMRLIDQGKISKEEILDWTTIICKKYKINNWSISKEGLVDVDSDVRFVETGITQIPLRFGIVTGNFLCMHNQLTSLEGSPKKVGGYFECSNNNLTTLTGAPQWVGGDFWCEVNQLTNLEGAPQEVGGDFVCNYNQLTTLKGSPKRVGGNFGCSKNQLTSLDGIGEIKGKVYSDLKTKKTFYNVISDLFNH